MTSNKTSPRGINSNEVALRWRGSSHLRLLHSDFDRFLFPLVLHAASVRGEHDLKLIERVSPFECDWNYWFKDKYFFLNLCFRRFSVEKLQQCKEIRKPSIVRLKSPLLDSNRMLLRNLDWIAIRKTIVSNFLFDLDYKASCRFLPVYVISFQFLAPSYDECTAAMRDQVPPYQSWRFATRIVPFQLWNENTCRRKGIA